MLPDHSSAPCTVCPPGNQPALFPKRERAGWLPGGDQVYFCPVHSSSIIAENFLICYERSGSKNAVGLLNASSLAE